MKKTGFTILELMVALTVTSVLVGSILGLLISQGRAVDGMRSGADQLEQVRAVTDFIGAEIEDLPRGAMVAATADSIAFRLPIAWGTVCGDLSRISMTKTKVKTTTVLPDITSGIFLEPSYQISERGLLRGESQVNGSQYGDEIRRLRQIPGG